MRRLPGADDVGRDYDGGPAPEPDAARPPPEAPRPVTPAPEPVPVTPDA